MYKIICSIICSVFFISCVETTQSNTGQVSNEEDMLDYGKKIYESQCVSCHDKNIKSNTAPVLDLTQTKLDEAAIEDLIYHGKGTMLPYKDKLGEPEITAVSRYVITLKASE